MPWTPRALPCSPPRLQVSPCPRRWPSVSQEVCSVLHEPRGCRGGFLLGRLWAWNYLGIHTKGDSERRSQPPPAPAWLQEGRGTLQAAILTCSCGHECMCRRVCLCRCVWCVQTCAQVHVGVQVCVQADVCECKHVCSRVCVVCKRVHVQMCVCEAEGEECDQAGSLGAAPIMGSGWQSLSILGPKAQPGWTHPPLCLGQALGMQPHETHGLALQRPRAPGRDTGMGCSVVPSCRSRHSARWTPSAPGNALPS